MRGPVNGDIVIMTNFTHVSPGLSVSYRQKDRKTVSVFLLLGHQNKDGTMPLDVTKAMNDLGWYRLDQKSPVARKRKCGCTKPAGRGD